MDHRFRPRIRPGLQHLAQRFRRLHVAHRPAAQYQDWRHAALLDRCPGRGQCCSRIRPVQQCTFRRVLPNRLQPNLRPNPRLTLPLLSRLHPSHYRIPLRLLWLRPPLVRQSLTLLPSRCPRRQFLHRIVSLPRLVPQLEPRQHHRLFLPRFRHLLVEESLD